MNNLFETATRGEVYVKFETEPLSISEREVSQAFDRSRLDPRLMEIATEFIRDFWWIMNPSELNKWCKKARFPYMVKAATLVILDQCKITTEDRPKFAKWMNLVIRGIKDPPLQLLYVGLLPVGSKAVHYEVTEAIPILFKHNLITKDLPFNKALPGVLKTESNLPANRVSEIDLIKIKLAKNLKQVKIDQHLSNNDLIKKTGINRVFMSKILNNKLANISVEYLLKKISVLK